MFIREFESIQNHETANIHNVGQSEAMRKKHEA
jgi:hypothetical protein